MAGKYFVQYAFGAGATGGMVPLIDRIGVGMATTVGECTCGTDVRGLTDRVSQVLGWCSSLVS